MALEPLGRLKLVDSILLNHFFYFFEILRNILMVTGMNAANGNQACLWCEADVKEIHDFGKDKKWQPRRWVEFPEMIDSDDPAAHDKAKAEYAKECSAHWKDHVKKAKGCGLTSIPLIDFIPLSHFVVDELHLFLRVTDKILDGLFLALDVQSNVPARMRIVAAFEDAGMYFLLFHSCFGIRLFLIIFNLFVGLVIQACTTFISNRSPPAL